MRRAEARRQGESLPHNFLSGGDERETGFEGFHFGGQRSAFEAEEAGGGGFVAADAGQGLAEEAGFKIIEGALVIHAVGRQRHCGGHRFGRGGSDKAEVGGEDHGPVAAHNHGGFDGVFEFADVAGPGAGFEAIERGAVERLKRDALGGANLLHEMTGERLDIAGAVAERGQPDLENIQTVEKILTEEALADAFSQIDVGGRDHADIETNAFVAAETLDLALLQDAEEASLEADGHVANFVEENGAVVGGFEFAGARLEGAGERSFVIAEELGFEKRFRDGSAIDRDPGTAASIARGVDLARGDFLTGTRFALNQHVAAAAGDHRDGGLYATHGVGEHRGRMDAGLVGEEIETERIIRVRDDVGGAGFDPGDGGFDAGGGIVDP